MLPKYPIKFEINNGLYITVKTGRLVLHSCSGADAKECSALFTNPVVMKTYGDGMPWKEEAVRDWMEKWEKQWREHDPFSLFMIRNSDSKECVGVIGFWQGKTAQKKNDPRIRQMFYVLDSRSWGMGFGREAADAVMRSLIPELMLRGYDLPEKLEATALLDNVPSRKILEGAGFTKRETVTEHGAQRYLYSLSSQYCYQLLHCFFNQVKTDKKEEQTDSCENKNDSSKVAGTDTYHEGMGGSSSEQKITLRSRL